MSPKLHTDLKAELWKVFTELVADNPLLFSKSTNFSMLKIYHHLICTVKVWKSIWFFFHKEQKLIMWRGLENDQPINKLLKDLGEMQTNWLTGWHTDWMTDWWTKYWLAPWLADWLIDWWTDWLTDWWTEHWLTNWLADWLIDWLTDWPIGWLMNWRLTDLLIFEITCWLTDLLIVQDIDGLTNWWTKHWLIDWLTDQLIDWLINCIHLKLPLCW